MIKKKYKLIFKKKPKYSIEKKVDIVTKDKLKCLCRSFCKQKSGNSIEENEDSIFEPTENEIASETILKFAISDGATESSFAKEWSNLLVSNYRDKLFDKDNFQKTIKELSEKWQLIANATELPWYAQEKVEGGAFATFLGLTINLQNYNWEAVAVGDSTLFHIRGGKLINSFPIKSSEEYGNTPSLISSGKNRIQEFDSLVSLSTGVIMSKDLILIGTDAVSAWILRQIEIGENPCKEFEIVFANNNNNNECENWLFEKRAQGEIKNDDSTLLLLKFE